MLTEFGALARYLRQHGVKAHFTMGGHFPTIEYSKTLELIPELDTVIRHEGEYTTLDLYNSLNINDDWDKIQGIAYKKNGEVKASSPRALIMNLDSLPFPIRATKTLKHRGIGMCSIIASRGCYYDCSFCSVQTFYRDVPGIKRRTRSPSHVAQEMETLFRDGVKIFKFVDDDLGMNTQVQKNWINEFARELENRHMGNDILWRISNRIDELDTDILTRLKEVGLTFLYIGIESGNDQGLITCNKHYTVEDVYRGLDVLEKADMNFDYGFMMLTPDSTLTSIEEDIKFLRNLTSNGRAIVHFTKMIPYVGTPICKRLKEEGRLEGTIESPNYRFNDPKLDILEMFLSKSFHDAIFEGGVVGKLRMLSFDLEVLKRFFDEQYYIKQYEKSVKNLILRYNESALETMELALNFMKKNEYNDILYYWNTFELLVQQELETQSKISALIETLSPEEL